MDQRLLVGGGIAVMGLLLIAGASASGWIDSEDESDGFQVPEEFEDFDPDAPQEIDSSSFQYNVDSDTILTEENISLEFTGLNGNQEYIFGFISEGEFLPVKNLSSSPGGAAQIDYDFRPVERDITFDYEKGGYQQYLYYPDGSPAHQVSFYSGLTFYNFDTFGYVDEIRDDWKIEREINRDTTSENFESVENDYLEIQGSTYNGHNTQISNDKISEGETVNLDLELEGNYVRRYQIIIEGEEIKISQERQFIEIEYRESTVTVRNQNETLSEIIAEGDVDWEIDYRAYRGSSGGTIRPENSNFFLYKYSVTPNYMNVVNPTTVELDQERNFVDYRLRSEENVGIEFRNGLESEFSPFFPEGNSDFMEVRNTDKGNITFVEYRVEESENGMVQSILSLF